MHRQYLLFGTRKSECVNQLNNDCHIYEKSGTGTRALSAARKAMLGNLGMQWPSNPPEKRTAWATRVIEKNAG